MAIITAHKFNGDGTQREFQVGDSILSKSHCRVWVDDVEPDSSTWDLLGSTILFDTAPPATAIENVRIYVSNDGTFPNEYTSPSSTEIVETYINEVINVAGGISSVAALSAISTEVVALAAVATAISSLYTDKAKLDSIYSDKNKLDSLFADKLTLDGLFSSKTAIDSLYTIQNKLESIFADKTKLDSIYADKIGLDSIATNLTELLNVDVLASQVASDKIAIETLYDNFDDRYLGNKASDPTLDNDGDALQIGAVYFNTTVNHTRFYNGSAWEDPEQTSTSAAAAALASQVAAELAETNAEAALASINTAISDAFTAAIGTTIQAYDANTVKYDVAGTFTKAQRASATVETNIIDFTPTNDFTITLGFQLSIIAGSVIGCDGQAGSIIISDVENIVGWSGFTWLGTAPTLTTGVGIFSYKIVGTTIYIVKVENA